MRTVILWVTRPSPWLPQRKRVRGIPVIMVPDRPGRMIAVISEAREGMTNRIPDMVRTKWQPWSKSSKVAAIARDPRMMARPGAKIKTTRGGLIRTDPQMTDTPMRRCWMGLVGITRRIPASRRTIALVSAVGMSARLGMHKQVQLDPGSPQSSESPSSGCKSHGTQC